MGQAINSGVEGAAYGGALGAVFGGFAGAITYNGPVSSNGISPSEVIDSPIGSKSTGTYSSHSVKGGGDLVKQGASLKDGVTFTENFVVTANRLPFGRSSITGLQLSNPAGSNIALSIPKNYIAIATQNGKGIIYGPQGVSHTNMSHAIRVHLNSTTYAHNGYVVFYNSSGQPFNPNTGKTLGKALWHFLIQ